MKIEEQSAFSRTVTISGDGMREDDAGGGGGAEKLVDRVWWARRMTFKAPVLREIVDPEAILCGLCLIWKWVVRMWMAVRDGMNCTLITYQLLLGDAGGATWAILFTAYSL
jgi:hypothetical protein